MKIILDVALALALYFAPTVLDDAGAHDRRFLRCALNSGPYCTPPAYLPQQQDFAFTGVWVWRYEQAAGVPSIRAPIVDALNGWASRKGFELLEVQTGGNLQYAASSREFTYGNGLRPGCPGATACLNRYGLDVDIWYDAPLMATYIYVAQVGVGYHEDCHAMADCGEYYIHTNGIHCNADPFTVMSCGIGHALTPQPFDLETFDLYHYPPAFDRCIWGTGQPCAGLDVASSGVYWCGRDRRANIVAVAYDDGEQGDGYYAAHKEYPNIAPTGACDGISVQLAPGRCYYLIQNNRLSWPARPWYQLAGCT